MLVEKFEIFLALFAGLILLVMGILVNFTLPAILLRLLIVLVVFYVVGLVVKTYLRKRIFFEIEVEDETEAEAEDTLDGEMAEVFEAETGVENQHQPML